MLVLLALGTVTPAGARIGDTLDQAINRYGPVKAERTISGLKWVGFAKSDYVILAAFDGKRIGYMQYIKQLESHHKESAELSPNEIQNFLKANANGKKWVEVRNNLWVTKPAGMSAMYNHATDRGWELAIMGDATAKKVGSMEAAEKDAIAIEPEGFP